MRCVLDPRVDKKAAWGYLLQLTRLKALSLNGNPCFRWDTARKRRQLLSRWKGTDRRNLPLKQLNGQSISLEERCRAIKFRKRQPAYSRLDLLLEEMKIDCTEEEADLTDKKLVNVSLFGYQASTPSPGGVDLIALAEGFAPWSNLQVLNLSKNKLTTLKGQGLHLLPALAYLDIARNNLPSLDHIITWLHRCRQMTQLHMLSATGDVETSSAVMCVPHRVMQHRRTHVCLARCVET